MRFAWTAERALELTDAQGTVWGYTRAAGADSGFAGAQVRILTPDAESIAAVHEFLAFQRMDHRAMGHDHATVTPPRVPPSV